MLLTFYRCHLHIKFEEYLYSNISNQSSTVLNYDIFQGQTEQYTTWNIPSSQQFRSVWIWTDIVQSFSVDHRRRCQTLECSQTRPPHLAHTPKTDDALRLTNLENCYIMDINSVDNAKQLMMESTRCSMKYFQPGEGRQLRSLLGRSDLKLVRMFGNDAFQSGNVRSRLNGLRLSGAEYFTNMFDGRRQR